MRSTMRIGLPPFPCQQRHDANEPFKGQTLHSHYDRVHNNY
jgi:hypothetical protein